MDHVCKPQTRRAPGPPTHAHAHVHMLRYFSGTSLQTFQGPLVICLVAALSGAEERMGDEEAGHNPRLHGSA